MKNNRNSDKTETSGNSRKNWERIGEQILAAAKQELYLAMRYLYLALEHIPGRADSQIHWIGTDGTFLYYQPMLLARAYAQDAITVNRACLHSVLHGMFGHMYHRQEREEGLWNLACDIMVEEIIDGLTLRPIQRLVPEMREQCYQWLREETKIHSAERIYEVLKCLEKKQLCPPLCFQAENPIPIWETLFQTDDHSLWNREKKEGTAAQEQEREQELWRETRERVQTEMETYARTAGIEKTRLYQELASQNREKTDYREFLQKFTRLRELARLDLNSFDYGYYEYGMRLYGNMPLIEELEYREEKQVQELAVVVDTSGSCSKELVSHFLEETVAVLEEAAGGLGESRAGTKGFCCHILQCDNQIQEEITVYSVGELQKYLEHMQIVGRGGTDFRPAFSYSEDKKRSGEWKELSGLLYFTDGYGIYPKHPPDFEVAFLFPEENWPDGKPPWKSESFPAWAMYVEIPR